MLLVEFLSRLSRDWRICKGQFERRSNKQQRLIDRLERQTNCISNIVLNGTKKECILAKAEQCKKKYDKRIVIAEDSAEQVNNDFHLHPFPDVVGRIAMLSGLKSTKIINAAAIRFDGCTRTVDRLNRLDGTDVMQSLFKQLLKEHPLLAQVIGLTGDVASNGRGRRAMGYQGREKDRLLAGEWKRARESRTTTKKTFCKDRGITCKALDAVLDRVRKRKQRSAQ